MKKKILFVNILLILILFNNCIYFPPHDEFFIKYKNESSHNVFIQYFREVRSENEPEETVYNINLDTILKLTEYEQEVPMNNNGFVPDVKKILIVDLDSKKILKKLDPESFFNLLSDRKKWVDKKFDGDVYNYRYHFIITDEYLNN